MIFELLGSLLDNIVTGEASALNNYKMDKSAYFEIRDEELIGRFILPLCDEIACSFFEDGNVETVLIIGKGDDSPNHEIVSIKLYGKGKELTYDVSEKVLDIISSSHLDGVYYEMCEVLYSMIT